MVTLQLTQLELWALRTALRAATLHDHPHETALQKALGDKAPDYRVFTQLCEHLLERTEGDAP